MRRERGHQKPDTTQLVAGCGLLRGCVVSRTGFLPLSLSCSDPDKGLMLLCRAMQAAWHEVLTQCQAEGGVCVELALLLWESEEES